MDQRIDRAKASACKGLDKSVRTPNGSGRVLMQLMNMCNMRHKQWEWDASQSLIGVKRHKATFATQTCTIVAFGWSAGLYGAITTALCQGLSIFSMADTVIHSATELSQEDHRNWH